MLAHVNLVSNNEDVLTYCEVCIVSRLGHNVVWRINNQAQLIELPSASRQTTCFSKEVLCLADWVIHHER